MSSNTSCFIYKQSQIAFIYFFVCVPFADRLGLNKLDFQEADQKILGFRQYSLREKSPNTEFFLVRIFQYSARVQENMDQRNSVFGHFSCSK